MTIKQASARTIPTAPTTRPTAQTSTPPPLPSSQPASAVMPTEVPLAAQSHSNLMSTSRGIEGVLYATHEGLPPVGAAMMVRLAFPGEESVLADTRVVFHRDPQTGERWPAAGLRFTMADPKRDALVTRFARLREPTYIPVELVAR